MQCRITGCYGTSKASAIAPRGCYSVTFDQIERKIASMSETLEAINAAPDAPNKQSSAKKGLAPRIRKMKIQYPELTDSEIARTVGCRPSNVSAVLKTFLGKNTEEQLKSFQENKADIYDALQVRLLSSLTQAKISKAKPMEIITGAAILEDKARLVRGQATGINVSVLLDVAQAIRERQSAPHPQAISDHGAGTQRSD